MPSAVELVAAGSVVCRGGWPALRFSDVVAEERTVSELVRVPSLARTAPTIPTG
jgi:hypothetical protein